jgi:CRP-like cAMP-binding protein
VTDVSRKFVPQTFEPGSFIFREGETADCAFIIEDGQVEVLVDSDDGSSIATNTIGKGELFGELALIDGLPRSASTRALEKTTVIVVTRQQFEAHLFQLTPAMRRIVKTVGQRVRRLSNEIAKAKSVADGPSIFSEP